jgi:hypothetical protein
VGDGVGDLGWRVSISLNLCAAKRCV